jgi:hypothetical protein
MKPCNNTKFQFPILLQTNKGRSLSVEALYASRNFNFQSFFKLTKGDHFLLKLYMHHILESSTIYNVVKNSFLFNMRSTSHYLVILVDQNNLDTFFFMFFNPTSTELKTPSVHIIYNLGLVFIFSIQTLKGV